MEQVRADSTLKQRAMATLFWLVWARVAAIIGFLGLGIMATAGGFALSDSNPTLDIVAGVGFFVGGMIGGGVGGRVATKYGLAARPFWLPPTIAVFVWGVISLQPWRDDLLSTLDAATILTAFGLNVPMLLGYCLWTWPVKQRADDEGPHEEAASLP